MRMKGAWTALSQLQSEWRKLWGHNRHQGSLGWGTPWCVILNGLLLPLDPQQLWKARRGRTRQES